MARILIVMIENSITENRREKEEMGSEGKKGVSGVGIEGQYTQMALISPPPPPPLPQ